MRVRGDQCNGAPVVGVEVDGTQVASAEVPQTEWRRVSVQGSWPAGRHTVSITFANDLLTYICDRNLRLDRIAFGAADGSTPPPPPP